MKFDAGSFVSFPGRCGGLVCVGLFLFAWNPALAEPRPPFEELSRATARIGARLDSEEGRYVGVGRTTAGSGCATRLFLKEGKSGWTVRGSLRIGEAELRLTGRAKDGLFRGEWDGARDDRAPLWVVGRCGDLTGSLRRDGAWGYLFRWRLLGLEGPVSGSFRLRPDLVAEFNAAQRALARLRSAVGGSRPDRGGS